MPDADPTPARTRMRPVDPRLLRYATASRGFFVAIAAIGVAQTLVIVAFAWLVTRAITGVIDGIPAAELTGILTALAGVIVLRAALLWAREIVCARASARVEAQLRAQLVTAIAALGPEWLAQRNTARLAVIAGRGLEALDAYFARYLPQLVLTVIATPILVAVMWWQDWISGLTVILTIPLIPLFMVLIGLATRAVQNAQWQTLGRLAARFADTVRGLSTLKLFSRQYRAVSSIEKVTASYRRETMRVLRVSFLSGFALELLASISVAIVAVSIGFRLIDGSLTLAVGLFVLLLAPEAYLPLRQVGVQFHAAAEGVAATDDVFAVLDAAAEAVPKTDAAEGTAGAVTDAADTPAVVVHGLRVRRGERLLPAVSFTAEPGTVTLIEGPSGSGKTSVLAALRGAAGFEGTATVAGRDVRALAPSAWLAWAGQQPGLIAGTIEDNVRLGDPATGPVGSDGADAEVAGPRALARRALHLSQAAGLDPATELGVQGAGLSGGQAQRVAVARAIYRHLSGHAPVIALDEPSAALDAATEQGLWRAVRTLADDGATVLLVSHRPTARAIADTIVSLQPAEVAA
ncbi:thiol reductant ABC exporter subunit CydD [Microbacterium aurum]|uniref:Thiol reductant ABC exporter subunit CydD n=1 Tax=Microbacterium aurum TaxID=36805 RepID=A0A1P8U6A1_9MICO|nr:thiol reductant ABC exporter subunit CydD [Microbacterium aurum]APZ33655.1 thiol reductant ABC exporter subunit CydD [Microbacterium aurum]MBM7827366.1 ATP-binding cassette subfamily C protein CydD [Microbacterium aurum]